VVPIMCVIGQMGTLEETSSYVLVCALLYIWSMAGNFKNKNSR
jgi:hypothetical protein